MTATITVIYDPTNRITVGPPDKLPPGVKFVVMKCDAPIENKVTVRRKAEALANLLLEELRTE